MVFKITFLSFDLPSRYESGINCLKIDTNGYPSIYGGGYSYPTLLYKYTFYGSFLRVAFRTGQNNNRNYGFILNYFAYANSELSVSSNEIASSVTLNGKGM